MGQSDFLISSHWTVSCSSGSFEQKHCQLSSQLASLCLCKHQRTGTLLRHTDDCLGSWEGLWNNLKETFCFYNFQRTPKTLKPIFTGTRVGAYSPVAKKERGRGTCEEVRLWLDQITFYVIDIGCPGFLQSSLGNIHITVLGPMKCFFWIFFLLFFQ